MQKLFQELKRRKVLTTLGVYAGAAFIIIQVAEIVFPRLLIPDWAVTFVIILAIVTKMRAMTNKKQIQWITNNRLSIIFTPFFVLLLTILLKLDLLC